MSKYYVEKVKNYIGGSWQSSSTDHVTVTNPATGDALGAVPVGTAADVDAAVAAAKAAFPGWRDTPAAARARYLFDLRNIMVEHYDELSRSARRSTARRSRRARGTSGAASRTSRPRAGDAVDDDGRRARADRGRHRLRERAPADGRLRHHRAVQLPLDGAVLVSAVRHRDGQHRRREAERAGALLAAAALRAHSREAEAPEGRVNMVNGGRDVVNGILDHNGHRRRRRSSARRRSPSTSTRAAARPASGCRRSAARRTSRSSPTTATGTSSIPNIIDSAFGCAGQRCLATSIVVGVGPAYGKLEEQLVAARQAGQGRQRHRAGRDDGPGHQREAQGARRSATSRSGLKEGAELLLDGRNCRSTANPKGHFLGPTIFAKVSPTMAIANEEIFGPVLCMHRGEDGRGSDRDGEAAPDGQRRLDLHVERRCRAQVRQRDRRLDGRREHRRRGADGVLHVRRRTSSRSSATSRRTARDSVTFYTQNKTSHSDGGGDAHRHATSQSV